MANVVQVVVPVAEVIIHVARVILVQGHVGDCVLLYRQMIRWPYMKQKQTHLFHLEHPVLFSIGVSCYPVRISYGNMAALGLSCQYLRSS